MDINTLKKQREKCLCLAQVKKHPLYGKLHTDKSKKKMSLSHKGKQNHQYGKARTLKVKKKISLANSGKNNPSSKSVMTPFGCFESFRLAAKSINCSHVTISRRVQNERFPDYYIVSP